MTIKLYDQDAYATEFTAKVVACEEVKKKKNTVYEVELDQTLFFPEEGGQSPDQGTLDGQEVLDVQIKKEVIVHTVKKPMEVGSEVKGVVAWTHRFYNMQQHTGEHIYSGLVHAAYGYDNVGFHLSDQIVTMDFNGVLTLEQAKAIEKKANEAIIKNIEVEISYPEKDVLAKMDYRSKIEIDGPVRIVTIPGYDVCACCAPHVKKTGEIGMLKVMSLQNYKGGVRLSILCGFRALEAFNEKADIIDALTTELSAKQEDLLKLVSKLKEENQGLRHELTQTKQQYMDLKLSEVSKDQKDVILFETELDNNVARETVNKLMTKHPGVCAIFTGTDEAGYRFIIGSVEQDAREIAKELREKCNARGGGSETMIQGSVSASKEELEKLFA